MPVNLKIVFEGEEESGSDSFEPWLIANKDRLDADLVADQQAVDAAFASVVVAQQSLAQARSSRSQTIAQNNLKLSQQIQALERAQHFIDGSLPQRQRHIFDRRPAGAEPG